jgi:hypothetical protein
MRVGTMEKPAVQARKAPATKTLAADIADAAANVVKDKLFANRPYLKFAFANPYNVSLVVGGLAAAGITLNPFLALVVLGLEGLWLLHAPSSARLQHILWDPRFARVREELERQQRDERMKGLGVDERARVEALVEHQKTIRRIAAQNPSFTADLLNNELVKTSRLVESFIDMSITCARYNDYLQSIDMDTLERDRRRWETLVRTGKEGDPQTELAKKNFAVLLKRFDKIREIRDYLRLATGQLDLIENSFQLIADQIVTMQSPQELSGQLDELITGVETIKESVADTEKLLSTLGITA